MTTETAAFEITCCSCHALFKARARGTGDQWRQRSLALPDRSEVLIAYLCGKCAARFSGDEAVRDYLEGELEQALNARLRQAC